LTTSVSTLKTYARPVIGEKTVDAIGTEDVLAILQPIWTDKTETAKRTQGRIENVLDFAAAHKWRDPLNLARWRGHLDKLLPKPSPVQAVRHHPAMPYTEVPGFMAELAEMESVSALALRFLILTATRTSEALQAQWSEIDLEARILTIPASRMKTRREASGSPLGRCHRRSGGPAPRRRQSLRLPGRPSWPPPVEHGRAATDARHGLRGEREPRSLRPARVPIIFPGLVRGGFQFPP
jgi:hypothetical protein